LQNAFLRVLTFSHFKSIHKLRRNILFVMIVHDVPLPTTLYGSIRLGPAKSSTEKM